MWIGVAMRRDEEPWHTQAACHNHPDADAVFFPTHTQGRGAKLACEAAFIVCYGCPVRSECLTETLRRERGLPLAMRHGVFAATTPAQRKALEAHPRRQTRP